MFHINNAFQSETKYVLCIETSELERRDKNILLAEHLNGNIILKCLQIFFPVETVWIKDSVMKKNHKNIFIKTSVLRLKGVINVKHLA